MYDASPAKCHIGTTLADILLVQLAGGWKREYGYECITRGSSVDYQRR